MCWAAGVTSSTPSKLSMASLCGEDVFRAPDPRMSAQLGVKRVASLDGSQLRRLAGRRTIGVDISAGGGYTIRRRFWREYLRTPCGGGGEGGCADYLLFLHIQQVVQVRSAICVVSDQKRTAIDRVVVYGFFRVQDRNGELRLVPIPAVLCIPAVLRLHISPPSHRCSGRWKAAGS